jgi:hypothetical protein
MNKYNFEQAIDIAKNTNAKLKRIDAEDTDVFQYHEDTDTLCTTKGSIFPAKGDIEANDWIIVGN